MITLKELVAPSAVHAAMRDPKEGKVVVGLDPPRPTCAACSAVYSEQTGLPAKAIVERSLVIRDTLTGVYRAIVHCHGSSDIVELPPNPDEHAVNNARAFTRGQQ